MFQLKLCIREDTVGAGFTSELTSFPSNSDKPAPYDMSRLSGAGLCKS